MKKPKTPPTEKKECKCCGLPIALRNPSGYCDHLYYPENCSGKCHPGAGEAEGWEEEFMSLNEMDVEGQISFISQLLSKRDDTAYAKGISKGRVEALKSTSVICWIAEYSYCKANGFPMGEGHTPPSIVYEQVEKDILSLISQLKEGKE